MKVTKKVPVYITDVNMDSNGGFTIKVGGEIGHTSKSLADNIIELMTNKNPLGEVEITLTVE